MATTRRRPGVLSKISRPRVHEALERRRLFLRLDEACERPVVWITAPPGAGKTTLSASYLTARGREGAWYRIDSDDEDPATFFYFLGAAARNLSPRRRPLPLLTPEYLPDLLGFTRRYFRDLCARLGKLGTLVLDNFQDLPATSHLHRLLAEGLSEIPPGVNVLILSRFEPPPVYSRLAATKAIASIDWDALKFTLDETRAICNASRRYTEIEIAHLHQLSGGWAAGLTLLLERTRSNDRLDVVGNPENLQGIFDYFATQIFELASPEHQHVLLHLSFLRRTTPSMARELSGSEQAGTLLDALYRRQLFVTRSLSQELISATRHPRPQAPEYVFELHALFRAFLRHQADETYTPKKLREIARRAAVLLGDRGEIQGALALQCDLEAWDEAMALVLDHAGSLLGQGRWETVVDWIGALPEDRVRHSPWLRYWLGTASGAGDPSQGRRHLEEALSLFCAEGDTLGQLLAMTGIVQSLTLENFPLRKIHEWLGPMHTLMDSGIRYPSASAELAVYSGFQNAALWTDSRSSTLVPISERILALVRDDSIETSHRLIAAAFELWYLNITGQFDRGLELERQVGALASAPEAFDLGRTSWYTARAWSLAFSDHDEAAALYARAEQIASENGFAQAAFMADHLAVYFHMMWGETAEAEAKLKRMEALMTKLDRAADSGRFQDGNYYLGKVFVLKGRDRYDAALPNAEAALAAIDASESRYFVLIWGALLADVFVESGQWGRAREILVRARSAKAGTQFECYEALLRFQEAYLALRSEGESAAEGPLRESLALAVREPTQLPFLRWILFGAPRALLSVALARDIEPILVRDLIRRWRLPAPARPSGPWAWPVRVCTLGGFSLYRDDEPVLFPRKAPKRLLQLLKAIVAFGGSGVPTSQLCDALWPDMDGDTAHQALEVAIRRLRDMLGAAQALKLQDGKVSLDPGQVHVDALEFSAARDGSATMPQSAWSLYRGVYLPSDDQPWVLSARERLCDQYRAATLALGSASEASKAWSDAIALYKRAVEFGVDPGVLRDRIAACEAAQTHAGDADPSAIRR